MELSETGQAAYQTLLLANQFEDNFIGVAAQPSKLVAAYRSLFKEPEVDSAFKHLLEQATPAGQLYALCGIYFTDHPFFLTAVEKYRNRSEIVHIQFGCLGWGMPFSEILEVKSPDVVRLPNPHQSLFDWQKEHPACSKLDIIGGGYPHIFHLGIA
jgi:hypothetical protein